MIHIDDKLTPEDFRNRLTRFWELSGEKILNISKDFDESKGSPVFTVQGKYAAKGWTEWTQGFQYGSAILNYEATGDKKYLQIGKEGTVQRMSSHLSHTGVHDHGFNNVSTYGNLLRLMNEGKLPENIWERNFYELALKISGAIQASRWTELKEDGYIYSFNGSHSLFIDTIRSIRSLMISHLLGHALMTEDDQKINLLKRAFSHIRTTSKYSIYYGEGRDQYDECGRTAHECIFNIKNGSFRTPGSQQGYSARTTWMRGLAWAILGFAEQLELTSYLKDLEFNGISSKREMLKLMSRVAKATCDFYIVNTPADGIPYWDSGAPGLAKMGDYLNSEADPYNNFEPVDSSAAVIAAQGFLRLGKFLEIENHEVESKKYFQAGLTIVDRLLSETYLSEDPGHQGLILHSIYHRPNGWDYIREKNKVSYGESSMWGDYHARELAIYLDKLINHSPYYTFFNCIR